MFMQSLYYTKKVSDINKLVVMQPNPSVFFKKFFELEAASLASILYFDP
jgi:hypothetical protein